MTRFEIFICGIIVLVAVIVFFALINYLGGYGAIIASIIIAGLCQWGVEEKTDKQ